MAVQNVAVRYGSLTVLKDVTFITRRGDRIVIVGKNGAGKSSLLRCLAGTQSSQSGEVKFGANVTVGYFAQEHEQLDFSKNVLAHLENATVVTESSDVPSSAPSGSGSRRTKCRAHCRGGERAKTGAGDSGGVGRESVAARRTDEQLGSVECIGVGRDDGPVEGNHRGGESRARIRRGDATPPTPSCCPREYFDCGATTTWT